MENAFPRLSILSVIAKLTGGIRLKSLQITHTPCEGGSQVENKFWKKNVTYYLLQLQDYINVLRSQTHM